MASDDSDARDDHIRAVTITASASVAGIFAAILSSVITAQAGLSGSAAATDMSSLAMLLFAVLIQIPLYRVLGFEGFGGGKDVLFVGFMTFAFWFVTYGIILTTGVQFL